MVVLQNNPTFTSSLLRKRQQNSDVIAAKDKGTTVLEIGVITKNIWVLHSGWTIVHKFMHNGWTRQKVTFLLNFYSLN